MVKVECSVMPPLPGAISVLDMQLLFQLHDPVLHQENHPCAESFELPDHEKIVIGRHPRAHGWVASTTQRSVPSETCLKYIVGNVLSPWFFIGFPSGHPGHARRVGFNRTPSTP